MKKSRSFSVTLPEESMRTLDTLASLRTGKEKRAQVITEALRHLRTLEIPALLGDAPVARETTRKVPKGEPK